MPMKETTNNRLLVVLFLVFAVLLYALIFGGNFGGPSGLSGERVAAVNFTLRNMKGRQVSLSDYLGKVVFLNIWATWCAPCRREMPEIQSLYRKMNPEEFVVLTISVDEGGREDVADFFRRRQLDVPTLLDPKAKISREYGVTGYPETFLIDKKGRLVERFIGPRRWLKPRFMTFYRQLIEES